MGKGKFMKMSIQKIKAILGSVLFLPFMGLEVCAWNDNTTSMVTYFPVPYAAYNNIYVSDIFDVGTSTKNFDLHLGSSGISQSALEAHTVTLRSTDSAKAQFKMESDVYTPTAYFGNVDAVGSGTATLEFTNLRIGTQPTIDTLKADELTVDELKLFGANLGGAGASCENGAGTVRIQDEIDIGAGEGRYVVCCPSGSGSCGTACYFANTQANRTRKDDCQENSSSHPKGTWIQNSEPAPECGCNCPSNSELNANGKCYCKTNYSYSGGSCVLSCSLYNYRSNHRSACCASYSGSNYSDTACWNLRWELTSTVESCGGYSSEDDGCSKLGAPLLNWNYEGGPVVDENDSCSVPGNTVRRVRYTGASCTTDTSKCAIITENLTCKNQISW